MNLGSRTLFPFKNGLERTLAVRSQIFYHRNQIFRVEVNHPDLRTLTVALLYEPWLIFFSAEKRVRED
jgi:hypothetical protein